MQPYDPPAAYAPVDPAYNATAPQAPSAYAVPPAYRRDPPPSRRRAFVFTPASDLPNGAKVLAAMFVIGALLAAIVGVQHLAAADAFDDNDRDRILVDEDGREIRAVDDGVRDGIGSGIGLIALAIASAAVAFGFMTGQTWAWIAGLAVGAVGLLVSLYGLFRGADMIVSVLGLMLSGAILGASFMPRVHQYFGARRADVVPRRYV